MKIAHVVFSAVMPALAAPVHAHTQGEVQNALAVICDRPEAMFSDEHEKALKVFTSSFSADRLAKLDLPDEAFAWLPEFGPCGGAGSPLLVAFIASAARDEISGQKEEIVYRGWLTVLKQYAYLRKTAPDDFPAIPALEEMAQKEKAGVLLDEARKIERKKEPIQTAQTTPGSCAPLRV